MFPNQSGASELIGHSTEPFVQRQPPYKRHPRTSLSRRSHRPPGREVFGPVLYSHLLKMASEKTDDRAADLWVPDLNLPHADMLPRNYVQSEAVRLEIYGRVARCRSEDDLEDLEEETTRRFGRLPPAACDFFAAAQLRINCKRRGIVRLDVGPEAVAATFLPG